MPHAKVTIWTWDKNAATLKVKNSSEFDFKAVVAVVALHRLSIQHQRQQQHQRKLRQNGYHSFNI
eukprot:3874132-Ditylum_brightwellii.AAC.1